MKNIIIKITVLVMVSIMQIGLGASVIEAAPINNLLSMQQQDNQDQREAERIENERHERAMERRGNESEQEWSERQNRENERHQRRLWIISRAIMR